MPEIKAIIRFYSEIDASQVEEIVSFLDSKITTKFTITRIQQDINGEKVE